MSRPWRHALSPTLRKITGQPAEPGFELGFQYRPIDSKVATPRAPLAGRPLVGVGVGVGEGVGVGVGLGVGVGDGLGVGVTVEFCTLTLMMSLRLLPLASKAVAVSVCVPFANLVVSIAHCIPSDMVLSVLSVVASMAKTTRVTPTPFT